MRFWFHPTVQVRPGKSRSCTGRLGNAGTTARRSRTVIGDINHRAAAWLNRLLAARVEEGPYRFLVRDWSRAEGLDGLATSIGLDYFRERIIPVSLPVERLESIVVLAPHQDDELIGPGGTLLRAIRQSGSAVTICFVTDGAQKRPGMTTQQVVAKRRAEARSVCEQLGAEMTELGIANKHPSLGTGVVDELRGLILERRPDVVMLPWLLDLPPIHRFVNHVFALAGERGDFPNFEVWGYQVHNAIFANGFVDITEFAEAKADLLRMYRTQNEFGKRHDHMTLGLNAWNSRYLPPAKPGMGERYAELFFTLPNDSYIELLCDLYHKDLSATYGSKPHLAEEIVSFRTGAYER